MLLATLALITYVPALTLCLFSGLPRLEGDEVDVRCKEGEPHELKASTWLGELDLEAGKAKEAEALLPHTFKKLDKAAKRHVIHKNTASNHKSKLAKAVATGASYTEQEIEQRVGSGAGKLAIGADRDVVGIIQNGANSQAFYVSTNAAGQVSPDDVHLVAVFEATTSADFIPFNFI